ncbi:hypothetical protein ACIA74_25400 [Streptomyces sp. NPDC051658]|uniref:hypothetical protein n=1 Tax=Streptomyces sp. NPDC051658 TaxID=3365667 RepID=UPI0037B9D4A4
MRQLSVPVRWAAVIAATVATSTGCMSIGDDGGKPAPSPSPSPSPEHGGSAARPDGGTVAGTGRIRTGGGRAEAHSEREAVESPGPSRSAGPSTAPGGVRPDAEAGGAEPPRGTAPPAPSAPPPGPGVPQQSASPAPSGPATPEPPSSPEPEPSEPSPPPSASPAAQLRSEALGASAESAPLRTPEVSPQVGPV